MRCAKTVWLVISASIATQPWISVTVRNSPSRTVLPTPRRPVTIMDCCVRPRASRDSRRSNARTSSSRPANSGGRAPALGV